ncbi:tape measure protein [Pseudomonas sp. PDNC002]|uniref:tape measure protein n=1 Tax=Pseudomonas sp. PDNC002 TaxID=2811422 RepID=UPI0019665AFC|nr:tape measure protein [Pseudomonas sp. PDNC002]QRY79635.1 tape measure protein [Pseudomonas sp. PDNC002]
MTEVELRLTADDAEARRAVSGFRAEYQKLVKDIERPLRQVNAFRDLESQLDSGSRRIQQARDRVRELGNELARTESPTKSLQASYKGAVADLQRLERVEAQHIVRLSAMRAELQAAGVDTKNLAAEQERLRSELGQRVNAGRADAGLAAASGTLGIDRYRALQAQLRALPADYERLSRAGFKSAAEQSAAQLQLQRRLEETRREIQELTVASQGGGRIQALIGGAAGLGLGLGVTEAVGAYIRAADQAKNLQSRLKLATESQEDFNTAQRELGRLADENQAPLASLYSLYTRLAPSLTELKRSQSDLLDVIEAVSASTRISGASAEEADASIVQFAQALGAGALRGDEFNSVAEQTPRLMRALADGLGVARGALKQMANDGQLTATVVINALLKQLPQLRAEAAALEKTTGGQFQVLANEASQAVAAVDDLTGHTKGLTTGLGFVSKAVKQIGDAFKALNKGGLAGLFEFDRQATQDNAVADAEKAVARIIAAKKELQDNGRFSIVTFLRFGTADMAELDRQQAKYQEYLDGLKKAREKAEAEAKTKRIAKVEMDEAKDRQRIYQEQLRALDGFAGSERALQAAREAGERGFQDRQDRARQGGLTKLKGYLNQQYQELKKAQANYEQVVGETETILKPFKDLTQSFKDGTAGPAADPSYNLVQDLKLKARTQIDDNPQKAIEYANKAREALEQLLSAGTNTYGLRGVAQELEDIATAAQEVRKVRAADIQNSVQDSITSLVRQADALKNLNVVVSWDQANEEQIKARMLALSKEIAEQLKFKVQVTAPDVDSNVARVTADTPAAPDGFAEGGWTGPGSRLQPAGVVHADEHVQPKRVVNEPGALTFLERVRRNGFTRTMADLRARFAGGLPGYADGGLVASMAVPSIPAPSADVLGALPGSSSALTPVNLFIDGQRYSMLAGQDTTKQIHRSALKKGHRRGGVT